MSKKRHSSETAEEVNTCKQKVLTKNRFTNKIIDFKIFCLFIVCYGRRSLEDSNTGSL